MQVISERQHEAKSSRRLLWPQENLQIFAVIFLEWWRLYGQFTI